MTNVIYKRKQVEGIGRFKLERDDLKDIKNISTEIFLEEVHFIRKSFIHVLFLQCVYPH